MNVICVVFALVLLYVRGDTNPAKPKQHIRLLSALHTRKLTNPWHLLSGHDAPWASSTFYLHTFMLIIKYKRLKSFLRKAEENGFTSICVLKSQMSYHYMKSSIIMTVTKGTAKLGRRTAARCSPACHVPLGAEHSPYCTDKSGSLPRSLSLHHRRKSGITLKDHNNLGGSCYQFTCHK